MLGMDDVAHAGECPVFGFHPLFHAICVPLAFYYQIASRVVEHVELPIGTTMSYGQISEIFFMIVMPFFFARLGVKWMLAIGMLAWVARYGLFSIGAPDEVRWMIIIGIVLHGICYDFFFVTGQIYTDQKAAKEIRAQAQGLLVMLTLGLGMMIGAQVAGKIEEQHTPQAAKDLNGQVVAKSDEIKKLNDSVTGNHSEEVKAQLETLNGEKIKLVRMSWLRLNESLWSKPTLFAAVVMILFVLLFSDKRKQGNSEKNES